MKIILPMTRHMEPVRHEPETPPAALADVGGKPLVAWVFDGLASVLSPRSPWGDGSPEQRFSPPPPRVTEVICLALAADEERHNLSGLIRPLVPRGIGLRILALDRQPPGELETVMKARGLFPSMDSGQAPSPDSPSSNLKFRSSNPPPQSSEDLLVARCDRVVRTGLVRTIASLRERGVRGIISAIGQPGETGAVVSADREEAGGQGTRVRRVTLSDGLVPLVSTGWFYFASSAEFFAAADAVLASPARQKRVNAAVARTRVEEEDWSVPWGPQDEPGPRPPARWDRLRPGPELGDVAEVYNEYLARGWSVSIARADEVWFPTSPYVGRLAWETGDGRGKRAGPGAAMIPSGQGGVQAIL